jgi:glyoxylase-like metal-dependent hydrolase (beta-lactamase superfamily II)
VEVQELAPGLWRWTARHPEWRPDARDGAAPDVGSVYCETGGGIVLVDPLVPPESEEAEQFWRALDRDVARVATAPAVVLTTVRHARSAAAVRERYPGTRVSAPGDVLPGGVEAYPTAAAGEVVLWLPAQRTLVAGDVLRGDAAGGLALTGSADGLRALLDLPVERVLVSHGDPVLARGRDALAQVLR